MEPDLYDGGIAVFKLMNGDIPGGKEIWAIEIEGWDVFRKASESSAES